MKKMINKKRGIISTILAVSLLCSSAIPVHAELKLGELSEENNQITAPSIGFYYSSDVVALDDLGISVIPSDYVTIRQDDGFVYIYNLEDGCIPYVIIGCYNMTADDFASQFTQYMSGEYEDLQVVSPEETVTLGEREFTFIQYSYKVSGYTVCDSRLFRAENGKTYMFGAKEIPELSMYVGSNLEETAGSFAYLAGGDSDYAKHVDSTRSVFADEQKASDPMEETEAIENTDPDNNSEYGSITFSQEKAYFNGTWVPFEDGFQLYLPSTWQTYELTDEQINQGVLYVAGDTSGNNTAPAVSVAWANSDGAETIEDLESLLSQAGYQVDGIASINGIPCVTYRVKESDCCAIMFFHPSNKQYILCVTGTPYSANVDTICTILTSLSPAS